MTIAEAQPQHVCTPKDTVHTLLLIQAHAVPDHILYCTVAGYLAQQARKGIVPLCGRNPTIHILN